MSLQPITFIVGNVLSVQQANGIFWAGISVKLGNLIWKEISPAKLLLKCENVLLQMIWCKKSSNQTKRPCSANSKKWFWKNIALAAAVSQNQSSHSFNFDVPSKSISLFLSLVYLPTYLPTYLRTYLPTYLPTYLGTKLGRFITEYKLCFYIKSDLLNILNFVFGRAKIEYKIDFRHILGSLIISKESQSWDFLFFERTKPTSSNCCWQRNTPSRFAEWSASK